MDRKVGGLSHLEVPLGQLKLVSLPLRFGKELPEGGLKSVEKQKQIAEERRNKLEGRKSRYFAAQLFLL